MQDLVAAAGEAAGSVSQIEAATPDGSVFVVREGDAFIAATTHSEPTVALVFYDLKTALRAAGPEAKSRRRTKKKDDGS